MQQQSVILNLAICDNNPAISYLAGYIPTTRTILRINRFAVVSS
jgi:hypothetical protein